jgi:hypothetical protein
MEKDHGNLQGPPACRVIGNPPFVSSIWTYPGGTTLYTSTGKDYEGKPFSNMVSHDKEPDYVAITNVGDAVKQPVIKENK